MFPTVAAVSTEELTGHSMAGVRDSRTLHTGQGSRGQKVRNQLTITRHGRQILEGLGVSDLMITAAELGEVGLF